MKLKNIFKILIYLLLVILIYIILFNIFKVDEIEKEEIPIIESIEESDLLPTPDRIVYKNINGEYIQFEPNTNEYNVIYTELCNRMENLIEGKVYSELEITSINEEYMKRGQLRVEKLGRGMTWFDTGTHDALIETASFVQTIQKRQGLQICCPEEIAFDKGWISSEQLLDLAQRYMKTDYGKYLKDVAENVFGEE